jgi:hypothetical protein
MRSILGLKFRFLVCGLSLLAGTEQLASGAYSPAVFQEAIDSYRMGEFSHAALLFGQIAGEKPASGTLLNLGNAQWQSGQSGAAVLAWEQARWLDPFNGAAAGNLRFARKVAQLESPELAWDEVVSTWLPVNWWAWITGLSFWFAVGIGTVPGILRFRRSAWQQALAAVALAIFLLTLPAHFGVNSRSRIAFVLEKNAPLRLTATEESQYLTRLQAGEPVRLERTRGNYLLIRTTRALGWVRRDQLGLICPLAPEAR